MKYIFTVLFTILTLVFFAQAPFLINYQGVARDAGGNPVTGQNITLKFEILQGSVSGPTIYTDNQAGIATSTLGIFSTQIGKNGTLGQVNWQGGPYFLRVSMDPAGGTNLTVLGTQQIVSVPYALRAETVPSSYTNNILTIGSRTHAISSGSAITISQGTGTNISVSAGPDYTISYAPPLLALTPNNASISIVGSNAVALPSLVTPTISTSGIATSTNGAFTYTVGVPPPNYNPVSGVLSFGSNNTVVTPTLQLSGNVLYSGPVSNSVAIPSGVTVAGTGLANVTGGPNYLVNVAQPSLALSANSLSLSIVGSNSIAFPAGVTVAGSGNIVTVNGGPANYTVGVPNPVWTGTALNIGSSSTIIAPTLVFSGGVLTSGASSNSVSLANFGPFGQAASSVTLTTLTNSVAIGTNAASAKLDVFSNSGGTVLKVNDATASNASPAVVISSNGVKSIDVTNNGTGGVGGAFNSSTGSALTAQSNSNTFPTFQAQNTSGATGAYAGNFIGGITTTGNGSTSSDFALKVTNSSSSNLLMVRNDGNVGIGTALPTQKLDVMGTVKITDGTEGAGKVLTSDAAGNASWLPVTITTPTTFAQQSLVSVNTTPSNFASPLASFTKVYTDTKIQVIMQTHLYVNDLVGTNAVIFELKLGSTSASGNSGKVNYFIDNANGLNFQSSMPVTVIAEFTGILPAGSYNVNLSAAANAVGTALGAGFDLGNFGANSLIIKEYR